MAEEREIYITSVAFGYVLAWQSTGNPSYAVVQVRDPNSKAQRWIVEPSDEKNVVAFRNAANGQYLNCQKPENFGRVTVGEKQLWRIDSPDFVPQPGGVRLQPKDFDKHFLNHDGPHQTKFGERGQKAHMWQWEQRWAINTVWYLGTTGDFDALAAATGQAGASTEESEKKAKELEARETAIAARESDAQKKDKELKDRETDMAEKNSKQQDDLKARQEDLQDRESKLASDEEKQKKKNEKETKKLQEREKALAEREKAGQENDGKAQDYQQKLKDLQAREQELAVKEKDSAASNSSKQEKLQEREAKLADEEKKRADEAEEKLKDLQKREADLEEREKRLKEQESATSEPVPSAEPEKPSDSRANQSKPRSAQNAMPNGAPSDLRDDELKAIQARLDKLEKQSNGPSQANGDSAAGKNGCDHKISRPPRKLERKVVGYVYAPKA